MPDQLQAVDDLKLIEPYEPNVVKAAWNIFGDSYRYRAEYVAYKAKRDADKGKMSGQLSLFDEGGERT